MEFSTLFVFGMMYRGSMDESALICKLDKMPYSDPSDQRYKAPY